MPRLLGAGQRLPRYLTQIELRAFFRAIASLRDRALFALVYHYGLRVGEVALLRCEDIDVQGLRFGPGGTLPPFQMISSSCCELMRGA